MKNLALLAILTTASSGCAVFNQMGDLATPTVTATHAGWTDVRAVGEKAPVAQALASGLSAASASIKISWNAMTLSSGSVESYHIYRATTSQGQDFSSPLATGISTTGLSYTDTTATAGTQYYYVVRPVSGGTAYATTQADTEIAILAPAANMALVHRWITNQETCALMGRTVDRDNHYRCAYAGLGNTGGYLDMGKSLLVDMYETGCNYTPAPACGDATHGCLGMAIPNNAVGNDGDVFYSRGTIHCYYKVGGVWMRENDAGLTYDNTIRQAMFTNKPGAPPAMCVAQQTSQDICNASGAAGVTGTKRLLSHREHIAAAAWDLSLSNAQIDALETGSSLSTTGYCNLNSANGLTFDDTVPAPADPETITASFTSGVRSLRTGSNGTRNCVSRYGIQDLVGNNHEWSSDQLSICSSVTHTCTGGTSPVVPTNTDYNGLVFDGTLGPGGVTVTIWQFAAMSYAATRFLVPLGMPIVGSAPASADSMAIGTGTGEFNPVHFHDNTIRINTDTSNTARGALSGASFTASPQAGRYTVTFAAAPTLNTQVNVGFRCAIPAP